MYSILPLARMFSFLLVPVLVMLAACGRGGSGKVEVSPALAAAPTAGELAFPDAASLRDGSTLAAESAGGSFRTDWPHNLVAAAGGAGVFSPADSGSHELADCAYAIYEMGGNQCPETGLQLDWDTVPAAGEAFAALANWQAERWDWFELEDPSYLMIDNYEPYISGENSIVFALLVQGSAAARLSRARIIQESPPPLYGDWNMYGSGAQHTWRSDFTGPASNMVRWMVDIPGVVSGPPAHDSSGNIYFACADTTAGIGRVYSYSADGTQNWMYQEEGSATVFGPAVNSGGQVIATTDTGKVICLSGLGELAWEYSTGWHFNSAPVLNLEDEIFACRYDDSLAASDTVLALDWDGSLLWEYTVNEDQARFAGPPSVDPDGGLFASLAGSGSTRIAAISSSGTETWTSSSFAQVARTSPVVGDGVLYLTTQSGYLFAVDKASGASVWSSAITSDNYTAPGLAVDGTVLLLPDSGTLSSFNPDGTVKWTQAITAPQWSGGVTSDSAGNVYAPTYSGVAAFDSAGEPRWELDTPGWRCQGISISDTGIGYAALLEDATTPSSRIYALGQDDDQPAQVYSVTPAAPTGVTGDEVHFSAECFGTGYSPFTYAWDFAGGASPGTSTAAEPTVTLGAAGIYQCSLTVQNPGGSDTYEFMLEVITNLELSGWPMLGGNAQHTGRSSHDAPPSCHVEWIYQTPKAIIGTPVIDTDGNVYFTCHDVSSVGPVLYSLDAAGGERWQYTFQTTGEYVKPPVAAPNGTVLVPCYDGKLHCVKPTGEFAWEAAVNYGASMGPVVTGDGSIYFTNYYSNLVYEFSLDGQLQAEINPGASYDFYVEPALGGSNRQYLVGDIVSSSHVIALEDREVVWVSDSFPQVLYAAPVVGQDDTVYCASSESSSPQLTAVSSSGLISWTYELPDRCFATPALGPSDEVYVLPASGGLLAISSTGQILWNYPDAFCDDWNGSLAVDGQGRILSPTDTGIAVLSSNGMLLWELEVPGWHGLGCIMAGPDLCYAVLTEDGGNPHGRIYAIGTVGNEPVQIFGVNPPLAAGDPGEQIEFSADCSGTAPLTYSWNFGGGASPDTSASAAPLATLGSAGSYSCSVQVSNPYGSDTREFTLLVDQQQPATDWPMWGYDSRHTRRSPYAGPATANVKWFADLGQHSSNSPGLDINGQVLTGEWNGRIFSFYPDGTEAWRYRAAGRMNGTAASGLDGTLYFLFSTFVLATTPDGERIWEYAIPEDHWSPHGSIAIDDQNRLCFNASKGTTYVLNSDGTLAWYGQNNLGSDSKYCTPAAGDDGNIYTISGSKLVAYTPAGVELWDFALEDTTQASPAIGDDGTIYIGCDSGEFFAVNPDGTEKWSYLTGDEIHASAAIGYDGKIYIGSQDTDFYALNPNGTLAWVFTDPGNWINSSALVDINGNLYFGSTDSVFYAVSSAGALLWSYDAIGNINGSPCLASDGALYYTTYSNYLYAMQDE